MATVETSVIFIVIDSQTVLDATKRYCFTRLLYGIHSASEVFQIKVTKIIDGIERTKTPIICPNKNA